MLPFLQNHNTGAVGNDKAVPIPVIGTGCLLGGIIKAGGECAHGVEHGRLAPMLFV